MKPTQAVLFCALLAGCAVPAGVMPAPQTGSIPVHKNAAAPQTGTVFQYETAPPTALAQLYTPQQAQVAIDQFKLAYAKLGAPRMDVRVNLQQAAAPGLPLPGALTGPSIDPNTGLPTATAVPLPSPIPVPAGVPVSRAGVTAALPRVFDAGSLADRQTRRDVERLFGRPLRQAGVQLMDSDLAALPEVTLEVLISERVLTVQGIAGAQAFTVPDIQVTAVRVADGRIIGQATVMDLFPKNEQAAHALRRFDVRQLAEATALALMKDIAGTLQ